MPTYQKNYSVKLYNRESEALDLLVKVGMFNGRSHAMRECTKVFFQVMECLYEGKTQQSNFTRFNEIKKRIDRNKDQMNQTELFHKKDGVTPSYLTLIKEGLRTEGK